MTLLETASWLIDIPSETGEEDAICTAIARRLVGRPQTRVGNSLVVGEPDDRPLVVLAGHLDTVPSQGQGPARVDDGVLRGLGAADMKSGVAVMIHLLEDPEVRAGSRNVVGVFYEAEEGPMDGNGLGPVLDSVDWLGDAEFAVVLEPSDSQIQLGCNGSINARVTFTGKTSHSARPWWGENAITKAGEWLAAMDRREPELHVVGGMEYREVFSVTLASGGIARNVIPDRFELNLNHRFTPDMSIDDATRRLQEVCTAADEVEVIDVAPSGPVAADHPIVDRLASVSGAERAAKQGWTDVARFGTIGVPAVNFGPGRASEAHQKDEFVEVSEIDATHRALRTVLSG